MPYQWTTTPDESRQELRLWPHNSLPLKGLAAFVLVTFAMILIPVITLLGSPVLWGLLPFALLAVWGVNHALQIEMLCCTLRQQGFKQRPLSLCQSIEEMESIVSF